MLEEYGTITRAAMRPYLRHRQPRRYLYDLMADYPSRGGRMLRPSLCIATARAFGAPAEEAVNSAVSLELMHTAFLVHDDIEDESEERRGQPTLPSSHGVALALNAGDGLALLALRPLLDNRPVLGDALSARILEEALSAAERSIEGQALDIGWRVENECRLEPADYLEMVMKKTCWYTTIHPLRVGALIGTEGAVDPDRFIRFGFFMGAAFQIQDDLLNLAGDPTRYGKEIGGDLRERKRTLALVRLLELVQDDETVSRELHTVLGMPSTEFEVDHANWLFELLEDHGCIEWARHYAHALAGAAEHECELAFDGTAPSDDRAFLEALPTWVLSRAEARA